MFLNRNSNNDRIIFKKNVLTRIIQLYYLKITFAIFSGSYFTDLIFSITGGVGYLIRGGVGV